MQQEMDKGKYAIFDHMIEGIQIVDKDWRYVYVNETVARQGKSSSQELTGRKMTEKYPGIDQTEMFALLRKCMKERNFVEMTNEFDFPDGSKGYFELRMQPVPEGVLILSFDVTALKRAEQTLKNANIELEEKVRERTSELTARNHELEQFAYVASHDLQEPLRTITSFSKLLLERYKGKFDERADKSLRFIVESSGRMKELIQALLRYSRIGSQGSRTKTDCNILVNEVLVDMQSLIDKSGAEIVCKGLPTLEVHATGFRQLMQNLISNAVKFRKEGTAPLITISAEMKNSDWVFSVSDNGIGIEEPYLEKIFLIFQRLHSISEYEGTGIGLAHCRKIVELHGGIIRVDSELGQGSTFSFNIPQ